MLLIDSHAHIDLPAFNGDRDQVLARARGQGVNAIINVGLDLESSQTSLKMAQGCPEIFTTVGFHPNSASRMVNGDHSLLAKLARDSNVVAIGEIGLDHHFVKDNELYPLQKKIFEQMLTLAQELHMPVNLHTKGAEKIIFDTLPSYDIPNVNIFETTNSKVLDTINPISVRNGWFDKRIKIVKFGISDLENTDNVVLSFSAPVRRGILSIKLNGGLIYEYDINSLNVEPIKLKKSLLREDNELEFSVSGVGAKFWRTNEYALENVKIIGDITDLSRQESQNVFTLTDTEYQNLEKAEIRFIPYCSSVANVGVLDVLINGINIFSGTPDCGLLNSYIVPPGVLNAGQNNIVFKTDKGNYLIDRIMVKINLKSLIHLIIV